MQYFPGADSPGSRQPFTLAQFLAERGHDVTVLAGAYNLDVDSKEAPLQLELPSSGMLRIARLPSMAGGRGSNLDRLGAYVSFMAVATCYGMALERPEVVLGSIQPLFTGLAALTVARLKGVPFVLEVRDLWPDALVAKKAVNSFQARLLAMLTNVLYRSADRLVSITPGIRAELIKKGVPEGKIDVLPNGFDPNLFELSQNDREQIRKRYGWGNDFVAIYTGSFTTVTAVDVIVRAANALKEAQGIRFELFGNGPTLHEVVRLAQNLSVTNVRFHSPVPKREIPGLLAGADVALMALFETPLAHIYFENKFLDYMGSGLPIIGALNGDQAEIIRDFGTGRVTRPGDHEGLARLVLESSRDTRGTSRMGQRGRSLVYNRFLLSEFLNRYAITLEAVAARKGSDIPPHEVKW